MESVETASRIDPELEALPEPRRPWRRMTLGTMAITALLAVGLVVRLGPLVTYGTRGGAPVELGALTGVQPGAKDAGSPQSWIRANGCASSSS